MERSDHNEKTSGNFMFGTSHCWYVLNKRTCNTYAAVEVTQSSYT